MLADKLYWYKMMESVNRCQLMLMAIKQVLSLRSVYQGTTTIFYAVELSMK